MTLRALSIKQPWLIAICHGKDVENRSKATRHRGRIALHASKAADRIAIGTIQWISDTIGVSLEQMLAEDHRGAVVAVAEIVGCHLHTDPIARCDYGGAPICSPWAARGHWHWQLANVRALAEPVPCKGALGLWRLPDDIDCLVRGQVGLGHSSC